MVHPFTLNFCTNLIFLQNYTRIGHCPCSVWIIEEKINKYKISNADSSNFKFLKNTRAVVIYDIWELVWVILITCQKDCVHLLGNQTRVTKWKIWAIWLPCEVNPSGISSLLCQNHECVDFLIFLTNVIFQSNFWKISYARDTNII